MNKQNAIRLGVPVACAALGGAIVALTGCNRGGGAKSGGTTPAGQAAVAQSLATQVSVTPARLQSISDIAEVTGALNSLNDVTVGVKANGRMVAVYAREGDAVRAGQVVAQQDTTDLRSQLEQQRANLLSAQTRLDQAKVAYQDAQTNLTLTQQQTTAAVKQAQAGLQSAKEALSIVRQGARLQERQQAQEAVTVAKADQASAAADRDKAAADLKRYQLLYRQQAISAQQLDQAQNVKDAADARYNSTAARVNSANQALSLIQEGARPEDIQRAQAAVEEANQTLVTAIANQNQVVLRRADLSTARAGITAAQAGIQQAQAQVHVAEQAVRDAAIVSPITGVVAERKVEPGMQVATVKPDVMRIVSLESIYFDAQLSEAQFSEVHIGQPVDVVIDALAGRKFRGSVNRIFPVASTQGRSFTARIGLLNEGNTLRPQMFARGRIILATHPNAIVVPHDAILDQSGVNGRLFVVQKNIAHERKVKTGFSNPRVTEIVSGVEAGESVITVGEGQLQDGDRVQVTPAGS